MSNYEVIETDGKIVKAWVKGVQLEPQARQQLINLSTMPFIHKHIAAMPDVHWGMGATIGSVIATKGAIIPAAVGVDIGCGMLACKTNLTAEDLPDSLHGLRLAMEAVVPVGRTDNGQANDLGAWKDDNLPTNLVNRWNNELLEGYLDIINKHPKAKAFNTYKHLGTLGSGNHFIELCLDEVGTVWVMLHSGSRGAGNKIGMYFIEQAKKEMEKYYIDTFLPDKDLSYLVEHTEIFNDYIFAVHWAQEFARINRELMLEAILTILGDSVKHIKPLVTETVVSCHHNYVAKENHFNSNVWVTRKGAVNAREGTLGIIPGSMGTKSYIVKGKGNKDSFCSCSHGAGRTMSRNEAVKTFTLADHTKATEGVECRKDIGVLDETPLAYKDIDSVMEAQKDLVSIEHTLKQILCIKG